MPEVTAKAILIELNALRDENDSLRQECQELRSEVKEHEDLIEAIGELIPPSYDEDAAMQEIILHFLRDMQKAGQIIAKLTSDYR